MHARGQITWRVAGNDGYNRRADSSCHATVGVQALGQQMAIGERVTLLTRSVFNTEWLFTSQKGSDNWESRCQKKNC